MLWSACSPKGSSFFYKKRSKKLPPTAKPLRGALCCSLKGAHSQTQLRLKHGCASSPFCCAARLGRRRGCGNAGSVGALTLAALLLMHVIPVLDTGIHLGGLRCRVQRNHRHQFESGVTALGCPMRPDQLGLLRLGLWPKQQQRCRCRAICLGQTSRCERS